MPPWANRPRAMFAKFKAFLAGTPNTTKRATTLGPVGGVAASRWGEGHSDRLGPPSAPLTSTATPNATPHPRGAAVQVLYEAVFDLRGRHELHVRESAAGAVAPRDMAVGGVAVHRGDLIVAIQRVSVRGLVRSLAVLWQRALRCSLYTCRPWCRHSLLRLSWRCLTLCNHTP